MRKKPLVIEDIISPDNLGMRIAEYFCDWDRYRETRIQEWTEIQKYIFATDTTKTGNAKLPWSNKTTLPKICQIRDNLHANYMAALFPRRGWLIWEGESQDDETMKKKEAIQSYMQWVVDRNRYYNIVSRLIYDYIDYGICFGMPRWADEETQSETGAFKVGYTGPEIQRISPLDIVFDPTAESFEKTPKIIKSLINIGEVKALIDIQTDDMEDGAAEALYKYLQDVRHAVQEYQGSVTHKNAIFNTAGISNFSDYLMSGTIEVLTFYGDIYDDSTGELMKNRIIKVVDRHKIISNKENPSFFSESPVYSAGWRLRPDSLWAMGPLENLIGMQYRIDHLENLKADVFDMIAYPVFKIKGYVEDFEWAPFERIILGDDGDVQMVAPDVQAIQADVQIQMYEQKMEEMAGSPKEAMGFRTPGEKTKYEVQRLENAASRIFQSKITQFERDFLEPCINGMLELARRNLTSQTIRVLDDEFKIAAFMTIEPEDLLGVGRIKPIAARHFAEQANMIQNLSAFFSSPLGADPGMRQHISTVRLAKLFETLLEVEDFSIIEPYIAISEQADAQRMMQAQQESVMMEAQTATGIGTDYDLEELQATPGMAGPAGSPGQGIPGAI